MREAREGNPSTFITLTVNPIRGESAAERAAELVDAMRTMFKRARRKFTKQKLEYLAVFEETKKGEPHLHILARAPFIPQAWLSEQMAELIQAPIVDIRRVNSARGAAQYVAKYVAKGPKSFGSLKRYWSTPGYAVGCKRKQRAKDEWGSPWRIEQEPLFLLYEKWTSMGFAPEWDGDHTILLFAGVRKEERT